MLSGRWYRRRHLKDAYRARDSKSALYLTLPAQPHLRLLLGLRHPLEGPQLKPSAFQFMVENVRKHLRK